MVANPSSNSFCMTAQGSSNLFIFNVERKNGVISVKSNHPIVLSGETSTSEPDFIVLRDDFLATASVAEDTVKFWTLSGQPLTRFRFSQGGLGALAVSEDTRLMSAACFTSEAKIVSLTRQSASSASSSAQAPLSGCAVLGFTTQHRSRLLSVVFSRDSEHLYTVSADGTWKRWLLRTLGKKDMRAEKTGTVPAPFLTYADTLSAPQAKSTAQKGKKDTRRRGEKEERGEKRGAWGVELDPSESMLLFHTPACATFVPFAQKQNPRTLSFRKPAHHFIYIPEQNLCIAHTADSEEALVYANAFH